jgi:hypothetical protein
VRRPTVLLQKKRVAPRKKEIDCHPERSEGSAFSRPPLGMAAKPITEK